MTNKDSTLTSWKEASFYLAFYKNLPKKMQEEVLNVMKSNPANEARRETPLPRTTTDEEAEAVFAAFEKACNEYLPFYANPFALISNNLGATKIYEGLKNLYKSLFLLLGIYFPSYDWSFYGLTTLLYINFPKNRPRLLPDINETPLDLMFYQIKTGKHFVKSEKTSEYEWQPTIFVNGITKQPVKDYPREHDGNLALDADPALNCYMKYFKVRLRLRKKCALDILSRYPFSYFCNKNVLSNMRKNANKREVTMMNVDDLYMAYHSQINSGVEFDLFERLRIESMFEFLNSPTAQDVQKKKYLRFLETALSNPSSHAAFAPNGPAAEQTPNEGRALEQNQTPTKNID